MAAPLVSIVIPTRNRPHQLPRAVQSALACHENCEVIIVPNGGDATWRSSLAGLLEHPQIHIYPLATANGNSARNHGMARARGEYLRFLDDDDCLLPAAMEQISLLQTSKADICSGAVEKVHAKGHVLACLAQGDQTDLVCAMVKPQRVCLPTAHVFRRAALDGFHWNESLAWEQDTDWMITLCSRREWLWRTTSRAVGQWIQHNDKRTSGKLTDTQRARFATQLLLAAWQTLHARQALTPRRTNALAEALWDFAHNNFFRNPLFWSKIARMAQTLNPAQRPAAQCYTWRSFRNIDPVYLEWLLTPERALKDLLRKILGLRR